jgi:hypothetical protein
MIVESVQSAAPATKPCSKCGIWKPFAAYSPRPEGRRMMSRCKECRAADRQRDRDSNPEHYRDITRKSRAKHHKEFLYYRARRAHLSVNFGISLQEYEALEAAQGGVCAICKKPEEALDSRRPGFKRKLAVDHCHTTGKIRGLLCGCCNTGIGQLKDSVEILENAITYLKRNT